MTEQNVVALFLDGAATSADRGRTRPAGSRSAQAGAGGGHRAGRDSHHLLDPRAQRLPDMSTSAGSCGRRHPQRPGRRDDLDHHRARSACRLAACSSSACRRRSAMTAVGRGRLRVSSPSSASWSPSAAARLELMTIPRRAARRCPAHCHARHPGCHPRPGAVHHRRRQPAQHCRSSWSTRSRQHGRGTASLTIIATVVRILGPAAPPGPVPARPRDQLEPRGEAQRQRSATLVMIYALSSLSPLRRLADVIDTISRADFDHTGVIAGVVHRRAPPVSGSVHPRRRRRC